MVNIILPKQVYTLEGIKHNNQFMNLELGKTSAIRIQEEHITYFNKLNNGSRLISYPLFFSISRSLYQDRNKPNVDQVRTFLKKSLEEGVLTSTRLIYNPTEKDEIIHNYKTSDQSSILENIAGPDGFIKNLKEPLVYKALLGSDNIEEINEVFKWLTKVRPYLWRLNSKPEEKTERIARFRANSGGVYLDCYWDPLDADAGLWVAQREIFE